MSPFTTDYFRALVGASENAMLLLADSLAEKMDTAAILAMMPVFNGMTESRFYTDNCGASTIANGETLTLTTTFSKVLQKILRPIDDAPAWTAEQNKIFSLSKPFLTQRDYDGYVFASDGAKDIRDTRVLEVANLKKNSASDLLGKVASESNSAFFAAIAPKLTDLHVSEWIDKALPGGVDGDKGNPTIMRGLIHVWNEPLGRAAIEEMLGRSDTRRQNGFRMHLLAQILDGELNPPAPERWTRAQIVDTMGVSTFKAAVDAVRSQVELSMSTKNAEQVCKDMEMASWGTPEAKLMKAALKSHCAPLIEAGEAIFRKAPALIDPSQVAIPGPLLDSTAFKDTMRVLGQLGFPLGNEPVKLGDRPRVCALEHLAKMPGGMEVNEAKLALLLDVGADPLARNFTNKAPGELLKSKADRDRWTSVVKSHKARHSAMAAIAEMDAETAGPSP